MRSAVRKNGGYTKSLENLNISLNKNLHLVKGESNNELITLCKKFNISDVYFNKCYEPWRLEKDKKLCNILNNINVNTHIYNGSLLWNPNNIHKDDGTPYKVFTPLQKRMFKPKTSKKTIQHT